MILALLALIAAMFYATTGSWDYLAVFIVGQISTVLLIGLLLERKGGA